MIAAWNRRHARRMMAERKENNIADHRAER